MEIVMYKKRQVNFELLRILCMYMIVIGHCLFHGRVTAKLGYGTVNSVVFSSSCELLCDDRWLFCH